MILGSSPGSSFSNDDPIFGLIAEGKYLSIPAVGARTESVLYPSLYSEQLKIEEIGDGPKLVPLKLFKGGKEVSEFSIKEVSDVKILPSNALFVVAYTSEPADYAVLVDGWLGERAIVMPVGSVFDENGVAKYVTPLIPVPVISWGGKTAELLFDGSRECDGYALIVVTPDFILGDKLTFRPVNTVGVKPPFVAFGFTRTATYGFAMISEELLETLREPVYLRALLIAKEGGEIGDFMVVSDASEISEIDVNAPNFVL